MTRDAVRPIDDQLIAEIVNRATQVRFAEAWSRRSWGVAGEPLFAEGQTFLSTETARAANVPEPSTLMLTLVGVGLVGVLGKRGAPSTS